MHAREFQPAMDREGGSEGVYQRWLDALTQSLDGFMRTPAFLQAMRLNIQTMVEFKRRQSQFEQSADCSSSARIADELANLGERLRGMEQTMLQRLAVVEERLAAIERGLAAAEVTRRWHGRSVA